MKNIRQSGRQPKCLSLSSVFIPPCELRNLFDEIFLQNGPDDKCEVQNYPTCTNIGISIRALSRGDRIWRKGTTKFSCSHLAISRYAGQATAQGNHQCQSNAVGQEKKGAWAESKNPYSNQEREPTFLVICKTQFL